MTNAAGVGTPCMWAPELWLADQCDGHKLDMWACGLMIYQLVAGALPFEDIDFEQELDPERLMFMSDTITAFGRQAGSAAGPPMPANSRDSVLSLELRQLLGGILQPDPGSRLTAAVAMQQAWCHAEYSASEAQAKIATYEASASQVRTATEKGLRAEDPNKWAGNPLGSPGQTELLQVDQRVLVASSRCEPEEAEGKDEEKDELDAVQAEIAKLKAEMGL